MGRMSRDVKETIDELWERDMDASDRADEIEQVIDDIGDYDAERDWQRVAEELGLI